MWGLKAWVANVDLRGFKACLRALTGTPRSVVRSDHRQSASTLTEAQCPS